MDKNMISVDDLVKQRLNGGEEQERPGAWLHMKELLDEKMPTAVPAAFNWRRFMSYMAAVLALSAIGIGGYKAISSMHNGDKSIAAAANTAANSNNKHTYHSNAANSATGNIITANDKDRYTGTNNMAPENNTANQNKTATKKNTVKNNTLKANTEISIPANAGDNATALVQDNSKNQAKNNSNKKLVNNNLDNNNSSVSADKATANASKPAHTIIPASGNNAKHNNVADIKKPAKSKIVPAPGNNPGNNLAVNTAPAINKAKDSIAAISVNEKTTIDKRTGKAKFTEEVVSVGKAPMPAIAQRPANSIATAENNYNNPRYVASAANGQVIETAQSEILPAAAAETKAATAENKNLGLAATHKARKSSGWNFDAVNQFFKDVKYNLGQVTYSTGITGGMNLIFFGEKTLPGFQLGATETLGLSDHISMTFELKYLQTLNKNMVVNDNYVQYTEDADHNSYRDSVIHFYNFSTIQNFSLPVTVHYKLGNWGIFAGGTAAYTLAINAEAGGGKIPPHQQVSKPTPEEIERTKQKILDDSFEGRFGLGYIWGVSYNFTPKFSVDARMTQNIWDNAKTPGSKVVSDHLNKKMGVQLSVNYDLSGNKKR